MEFKVENLCGFLIRGKLMKPEEMLAMRQRWTTEAKSSATQSTQFLKWLVSRNYVTEFQAGLLSRGLVDDFFLGEYKLLERIGRGRMAGVYKATHPAGQVVAIKVLPPSRAKDPQLLGRFQRESRLALKLKHPHVVRAFQVGQTKRLHYLVMEFLQGETLDETLQRRKCLPAPEAVRLIHHALLGLQHIHEQGMVHRDLKPGNLMLLPAPAQGSNETTLRCNVKILDIGLAREFFDENDPNIDKEELTVEGVLLGTPDYLAPEQARDPRTIDIRADLYSLGCTLYHLLTGQTPFPDKNVLNQMIRHATETPKALTDLVPGLPEGLDQIVNWMMAKDPAQRYPTPLRAAQAMDAFLMVVGETLPSEPETAQMKEYLTWLEMAEHGGTAPEESPRPAATASVPPQPTKPRTNPAIPNAPMKPAGPPSKKTPMPVAKKEGSGVRMPAAPVVAEPVQTPPFVPPPAPADQLDVELIEAPQLKPARLGMRDLLMLGAGAAVMLLLLGGCSILWWIIGYFTSGPDDE